MFAEEMPLPGKKRQGAKTRGGVKARSGQRAAPFMARSEDDTEQGFVYEKKARKPDDVAYQFLSAATKGGLEKKGPLRMMMKPSLKQVDRAFMNLESKLGAVGHSCISAYRKWSSASTAGGGFWNTDDGAMFENLIITYWKQLTLAISQRKKAMDKILQSKAEFNWMFPPLSEAIVNPVEWCESNVSSQYCQNEDEDEIREKVLTDMPPYKMSDEQNCGRNDNLDNSFGVHTALMTEIGHFQSIYSRIKNSIMTEKQSKTEFYKAWTDMLILVKRKWLDKETTGIPKDEKVVELFFKFLETPSIDQWNSAVCSGVLVKFIETFYGSGILTGKEDARRFISVNKDYLQDELVEGINVYDQYPVGRDISITFYNRYLRFVQLLFVPKGDDNDLEDDWAVINKIQNKYKAEKVWAENITDEMLYSDDNVYHKLEKVDLPVPSRTPGEKKAELRSKKKKQKKKKKASRRRGPAEACPAADTGNIEMGGKSIAVKDILADIRNLEVAFRQLRSVFDNEDTSFTEKSKAVVKKFYQALEKTFFSKPFVGEFLCYTQAIKGEFSNRDEFEEWKKFYIEVILQLGIEPMDFEMAEGSPEEGSREEESPVLFDLFDIDSEGGSKSPKGKKRQEEKDSDEGSKNPREKKRQIN